MMYHQKAAHGIDVKLTPGLEERYLRARANQQHRKLMQITQLGHMISPIDESSRVATVTSDDEKVEHAVNEKVRSRKEDMDVTSTANSEKIIVSNYIDEPENLSMDYKQKKILPEHELKKKDMVDIERGISTESDTDSAFVNSTGSTITACTDGNNKADASSFDSGFHNESSERNLSIDEGMNVDCKLHTSISALDMSKEETMDRVCHPSLSAPFKKTDQEMENDSNNVTVENERVLVTKLEGESISSIADVSLYKCYLCGQIFTLLSKLQTHLVSHAEVNMPNNLSQCPYCSAVFKMKAHLGKHVRTGHKTIYSVLSVNEKLEYPEDDANSVDSYVDEGLGSSTTHLEPDLMIGYKREIRQESDLEKSNMEQDIKEDEQQKHDEKQMMDVEEENRKVMRMKIDDETGAESFKHLQDVTSPGPKEALLTSTPLVDAESNFPLVRGSDGMYSCRYCSRSFYRLFSLQRHERVHTGFKPCFCRLCGKGFSEPRNLRQHLSRFHPDYDTETAIAIRSPTTPTGRRSSLSPESNGSSSVSPSYLNTSGIAPISTKRARRSYNRTAQRLLKVTPDMIEDKEVLNLSCKPSDIGAANASTKNLESSTGIDPRKSQHDGKYRLLEECPQRIMESPVSPTAAKPLLVNQKYVHESIEDIRVKERLGEDVTVVIPSDSPLDTPNKSKLVPEAYETPKSGEVQRPAWKHLFLNKQRNRRQSSVSGGGESETTTVTNIGSSLLYIS